jgi:hypothetical protein
VTARHIHRPFHFALGLFESIEFIADNNTVGTLGGRGAHCRYSTRNMFVIIPYSIFFRSSSWLVADKHCFPVGAAIDPSTVFPICSYGVEGISLFAGAHYV